MNDKSYQRWSEREIDFLKRNYKKMTHREMGRKLGRTTYAVGSECQVLGLKKRGKIVVNKEPTPDLAYVLGVCLGDGCVFKRKNRPQYLIILAVKDRIFAVSFREALENIGLRPSKIYHEKRGLWRVTAISKDFYNWYHSLDYKDMRNILVTGKTKKEFIKGFYESEGWFHRKATTWNVTMASCDFELLKFVEELVNHLGFKTSIYKQERKRHGEKTIDFILHLLGGSREAIRFLRAVDPCIPRKSLEKIDFSDRRGLIQQQKPWSEREEEFMQKKYPKREMSVKRICKILNRSEGSVYGKARQMGLKKPSTLPWVH